MAQALTTQFLFRRWSNQAAPAGGSDPVLQAMIDLVSTAVATRLDRTFESATYRKWHNGTGTPTLQLDQWPVLALYGLGVSYQNAITITNTSAQYAAIQTTETGFTLFFVTAGIETESTLLFVTYPTVTLLAAAVNALSGWSATVLSNLGSQPSAIIRPRLTGTCVSPDTFDIEIPDQYEQCRFCERTNRTIERRYGSIFPPGLSNIFVWYKAGYTLPVDNANHTALTTVGTVPLDLTQACNAIVKAVIDGSDDILGASSGGAIGDFGYQLTAGGRSILSVALDENMPALLPYRNLHLGV